MVQLTSRLEAAVQLVQKIVVDSRESLTAIELLECAAGTRAAPAGGPWVSMGQRTTVGQENELALRIATNALRMAHNESETLLVELRRRERLLKQTSGPEAAEAAPKKEDDTGFKSFLAQQYNTSGLALM